MRRAALVFIAALGGTAAASVLADALRASGFI